VTGVTWSRVVQLERQEWVAKRSSWVPSDDVRNVKKHTESYLAAVTDTQPGMPDANGMPGPPTTTTRMEPRFRTYYTFETLEWHKGAAPQASGTSQDGVAWPAYELGPRERVRNQTETYTANFAAGDKTYEAKLPEQEWRALRPGGSCQLTLGLFGGVKKVTPAGG
jgi:hypothetical protein